MHTPPRTIGHMPVPLPLHPPLATCVQLLNGNFKHHIKKLKEEEYESYNSDKPIIYEDLVHDLIMECLYFIA